MYKVTDINFGNPKQKGDGSSGGIKCESTKSANTILSKISTSSDIMNSHQHAEQTLQDQVSSFYNTIKPSQPKELTTDLYKLPSYTESQCKTSKIQYKGNNANMNTERFHQFGGCSSLLNEKSVNRITETNCDDEIDDDNYISDSETTDSDFSNLSGLSDLSGQEWKPITKPLTWVQKQMHSGVNPRDILSQILSNGTTIAPNMNDLSLWRILASMLSEPPRRQKLKHINTIEDVVGLLEKSNNIIVLTGAGVSVSCGIPDFRSSDGIYSRLAKDFPDLPDPQAMFDINYFSRDPRPFYKFAREIYPGQFVPSPCHRFIKLLEKKQKLLRNYTQNIDTLEQVAGIKNVIECHGSFATASCTRCKYKTTADVIRGDIFEQRIPLCPKCQPDNDVDIKGSILSYSDLVQRGIMKPDIVFFGEGLPDVFHSAMASDKDKCDLLIVIGSSLKVRPVALIPSSIPADVPQILINREQLSHLEFDVELLGDSDIIINQLCKLLGGEDWLEICWNSNVLHQTKQLKFEPAAQKDDAKSSNLHSSSIDTDSQSIITTNSSNGGFFDSGFESTSSTDILRCSNNKESRFNMTNIDQLRPSCSSGSQDQQILKDSATMNCDAESNSLLLDLPDHTNVVKFQKNTNVRHMSVDSSKDSGICDLSSSNFVPLSSTSTTCTNSSHIVEEDEEDDDDVTERNNVHELENDIIYHERSHEKISTSCNEDYLWLNNKSTVRSAGERLFDNTYYYHPSTCSYVFPGAQVYFNSDEENDDDADDDNDDVDHSSNKKELVVDDSTTNNESNNGGGGENRNDIIINCESDSDSPPNKKRKDHN